MTAPECTIDHLARALALGQRVVDGTDWSDATRSLATPCRNFTVAQLGEHIVDTHNLLLTAAGGDPVPGELAAVHAPLAAACVQRWTERGLDGTIGLGGNDLPASFGLALHTLEAYVHAWDLAQAVGGVFESDDALTEVVAGAAQMIVSDDIRGGPFGEPYGAAIDVDSDAGPIDRLVAFTGRSPAQPLG